MCLLCHKIVLKHWHTAYKAHTDRQAGRHNDGCSETNIPLSCEGVYRKQLIKTGTSRYDTRCLKQIIRRIKGGGVHMFGLTLHNIGFNNFHSDRIRQPWFLSSKAFHNISSLPSLQSPRSSVYWLTSGGHTIHAPWSCVTPSTPRTKTCSQWRRSARTGTDIFPVTEHEYLLSCKDRTFWNGIV
jgi:hypothetical protein